MLNVLLVHQFPAAAERALPALAHARAGFGQRRAVKLPIQPGALTAQPRG